MERRAREVVIAAMVAGASLLLGAFTTHWIMSRTRDETEQPPSTALASSSSDYLLGILSEAENDMVAKRYADALEKLVWFHENALGVDKASAGVRLAYALSDWRRLADMYPPALAKLEKHVERLPKEQGAPRDKGTPREARLAHP